MHGGAGADGMRRLDMEYPSAAVGEFAGSKTTTTTTTTDEFDKLQHVQVLPDRLKFGPPKHTRRLRVLFGILTADFKNDETYRKRHRTLFKLWNDKRVCSLPDFKSMPLEERYECELIYTFVMGANPNATTELVDDSRPFEVTRPVRGTCSDLNEPDTTLLNIRYVGERGIACLHQIFLTAMHLQRKYERRQITNLDVLRCQNCTRIRS